MCINSVLNSKNLLANGIPAIATITNNRIHYELGKSHGIPFKSYDVQYEFTVDDKTYTHSDETLRSNLWVSLLKEDYEDVIRSEKINIIYSEKNPSINRPAIGVNKNTINFDFISSALIFIILFLLIASLIFLEVRKK